MLEILGSIINGFALPLKEEHKIFLLKVTDLGVRSFFPITLQLLLMMLMLTLDQPLMDLNHVGIPHHL